MVDPDLEIRGEGGWGSGHPEPLDKGGGGVSKKIFFGPSGLSFV